MPKMLVVRGYIIPHTINRDIIYAERVSGNELIAIYETKIINNVINDFRRHKGVLETAEDVNHFLNMLAIYIKSLLYLDPIRDGDKIIIASPISYFYKYYIRKHLTKEIRGEAAKLYRRAGLETYVNKISNKGGIKEISELKSRVDPSDIIKLLKMPADTRPAANTSSLILHLLVTSAIASSIYISRYKDRFTNEDLAYIRFLSFFHDIGKFTRWRGHEEESAKIIEKWFIESGFVREGSQAYNIIKKVIELLGNPLERKKDEFYKIFKDSDRYASMFDRLIKLLPYALSDESKSKLLDRINSYFKSNYKSLEEALSHEDSPVLKSWEFWNNFLSIDEVEFITREFCKYASRITPDNKIIHHLMEGGAEVLTKDVEFVRLDIRGIQSYIKCNDLRSIMGGSRIIDLVIYASLPDLIMNLKPGIPYECILTFGGGNLTTLLPAGYSSLLREKIDGETGIKKEFDIEGVKIALGSSPFYDNYTTIDRMLGMNLSQYKMYSEVSENTILISLDQIFKKCEFCGVKPAAKPVDTIESRKYICDECSFKRIVGDYEYFLYRIYSYPKLTIERKTEIGKGDILVFIAGNTIEKARRKPETEEEKYLNLALVKFDGNAVGQFMASAISITDAFERSIRVDYAVKLAVNEFYEILKDVSYKKNNYLMPLRFILGYMYCGGDDGAFIMPASLSIPFALYILNRYHELMGGKSTLSLAIVATKPKHPIIPLYEAADKLLHHAKSAGGRHLCYEFIHSQSLDRVSDRYRGAISILNVDTGRISEEYISDILGILWEDRVGIQNKHSYTLSSINNDDSILRLLRIAVPHITPNLYNLKNYVDKILQDIVLEYNEETSYIDLLRDVREIVKDTVSISVAGTSDVKVKISYVTARGHEAFKLIRDRKLIDKGTLASLLLYIDKDGYALKLIDLEFIIKLLSGGRI